jgi:hypothetical protein
MFNMTELTEDTGTRVECVFDCGKFHAKVAYFADIQSDDDDWQRHVPRTYAELATRITFHYANGVIKMVKNRRV